MNDIKEKINQLLDNNEKNYEELTYFIENDILFKKDLDKSNVSFNLICSDDLINNEYLNNIKLNNINVNNIRLKECVYKKEQLFLCNTYNVKNLKETANIGFFNKDVKFPVLYQNDMPWMSIVPSEINTMKNDIKTINGNVLILGCGLGYIAYMLSLKPDVNNITIVEKNNDILNIFKKYILPQFKYKNKINLVLSDALNYLDKKIDVYDYVYSDIWYNGIDGLEIYLMIKKKEILNKKTKFLYWIEDEILQQLRIRICENFLNDNLTKNQKIFLKNINNINDLFCLIDNNSLLNNYLVKCNFIL